MRDYHIHTSLCGHARGTMEEYVRSAVRKGLNEICFSDHIPLPGRVDASHRMAAEQMDCYIAEIIRLRGAYPEISILSGIEADYLAGCEAYLEKFLDSYPFDMVIMSVHFVTGWPAGNWVFNYSFPEKTLTQVYAEYLDTMLAGVKSGLFDVVGHLDLIKKPGHPLLRENRSQLTDLVAEIRRQDMSVEINTSGFGREIGEPYPDFELVSFLTEQGITLTTGSDAHWPDRVGFRFREVLKKLVEMKHGSLARYAGRQKTVELPEKMIARNHCAPAF